MEKCYGGWGGASYLLSVTDSFFLCCCCCCWGQIAEWRNSEVKGEKGAFF